MRRFGLIGKSLSHSFSPTYFAQKFQEQGILDAHYEAFELPDISDIKTLLTLEGLVGLNVTIPYKSAVLPFVDVLSPEAQAIGAVNTLHLSQGKVYGHNTDVPGFLSCLKPILRSHHERALVLGSGGASAAVCYGLRQLGLQVIVVSRSPQTANQASYSDLTADAMKHFNLVVNTTPVGQHPDTQHAPNIPYAGLTKAHLLVDLIYNPFPTQFLQQGAEKGASIIGGLHMLHAQAEAAWNIWNTPVH